MRRLCSLLLTATIVLAGYSAHAAVAYDTNCSNGANAATSVSCTLTVGSLSNGIMLIFVNDDEDPNTTTVTTPTVGGSTTGVTSVGTFNITGNVYRIHVFYKLAPSSGSTTVGTTTTNTANLAIGVVTYSGVDQATPYRTPTSGDAANNTTMSLGITTVSGDIVVTGVFFFGNNANTVLNNTGASPAVTARINNNSFQVGTSIGEQTATSTTTTYSGGFDFGTWHGEYGIPLIASSGSTPDTSKFIRRVQ